MTKITRTVAVTLLAMLLPSFAMAANLFDIPSGDISLKVLGAIFGGLLDSGGGGMNADPLLSGIKVFNGGCLIIGGILAAYTILAGTLGTAHDGEMLGKKFSSVWIPIRYSVGTALVLPVVGGGYCVMQAIVMWLVVQGIGLADGVWSAFMSNPTSAANTNAQTYRDQVISTAEAAFNASMCYQSYSRAISESHSVLKWGNYNYSKNKTSKGWVYGDSTSSVRINGCGEINYPQDENVTKTDSTIVNTTASTNPGYLGSLGTIFAPMDISAIRQAHNDQTDLLVDKMDKLAKAVIATAPKPTTDGVYGATMTPDQATAYYAQISQAADDYLKGVKKAADGLSTGDAYTKIQQAASNQGWILAGAWFTRIVQMNDTINKAVASTPTDESSIAGPLLDSAIFADASKYYEGASLVLAGNPNSKPGSFISSSPDAENTAKSGVHSTGNPLKAFQRKITTLLTGVNLYDLKNDTRHPLIVINELGNRLLNTVEIIILGMAATAYTTGAFTGFLTGGAQNGVITILGWLLDVPIKLLTGGGAMASYVIPNMPFIIWIGCIVGWVLLVIEAIIAAPLWAIMHLHPNGEDLTGRAGNGYSLVLSLLLRPVLMVFGMEASIVISSVIGELINKTFFEVFAQSTGSLGGFSALFALSMGVVVYLSVMFIFVKKCFGIVYQLPDQMLQWIGGGGSHLGQFAGEFSQASDKAAGMSSALTGFAAGGASLAGKTALGAIKAKADQKSRLASQQDAAMNDAADRKYGAGTASQAGATHAEMFAKNDSLNAQKKASANKGAFYGGMEAAASSDPEHGKTDFESEMAQSAANNHAEFGGNFAQAAQTIGQRIQDRNLAGNPNGNFIKAAAGGNTNELRKAMNTIGRMEASIGAGHTKEILDKALESGATGRDLIGKAQELYQAVKEKPTEPTPPPENDS